MFWEFFRSHLLATKEYIALSLLISNLFEVDVSYTQVKAGPKCITCDTEVCESVAIVRKVLP